MQSAIVIRIYEFVVGYLDLWLDALVKISFWLYRRFLKTVVLCIELAYCLRLRPCRLFLGSEAIFGTEGFFYERYNLVHRMSRPVVPYVI